MPMSVRQCIAQMSYPGLNNYSKSINWTTASDGMVAAVWQRYEALIDSLDGSEDPFGTPTFWDRMLGEEALQIEAQAQPDPKPRASESSDGPLTPSNATAAPADPSQDDIDAPKEAEDPELIEVDEEGKTQIAAASNDDIEMLPIDDNSEIGTGTAEPEADVPARPPSPLPGPSHRSPQPEASADAADQIGGALDDHIEMRPIDNIYVRRFGTRTQGYEVEFRNMDTVNDLHAVLQRAIEMAVERTTGEAHPSELIGLQVNAPALKKPVLVQFRPRETLDMDKVMHLLEEVMQSNTQVAVDDNMTIRVTSVRPPTAGLRKRPPFQSNLPKFLEQHKQAILKIHNDDLLCVPRAIVVGIAHAEKGETPAKMRHYNNVRQGDNQRRTAQKRLAKELANHAGIDQTRILSIFDSTRFVQVFSGPQRPTTITLLIADHHCYLVKSMPTLFHTSYYCEDCQSGYDHRERHKCPAVCPSCFEHPHCRSRAWVSCLDCNRTFVSQECFDNHKRDYTERDGKRSHITPFCEIYRLCPTCNVRLDPGHKCGYRKCNVCKSPRKKSENHQCFMQKYKPKKTANKKPIFIFFDTESTIDTQICENALGAVTKHIVNTAVSLKVCEDCIIAADPEADCNRCGTRQEKLQIFFGDNTLDELCNYLFDPIHTGVCILAHNFKSYDGQFILQWLDNQNCEPDVIMRGLELLSLQTDNGRIKFRDTLCYLPMRLSAFSKPFDLKISKGDFPFRDTTNRAVCEHTDDERALTGTWVTEELYAALEDGYQVLEIYEVYHWSTMLQYDGKDPDTALFASYVSWAIKLKVEASGYPPGVTTEEQKQKFRDDYLKYENIELDPAKMQYNASLRSLAKLCANSFWGKFGQRSDTGSIRYFTEPAEFYAFVFDPTIQVKGIRICTDTKLAVAYKKLNDFVEAPGYVSVVIAAWTTAQARLKLLSYLRPLGRRALYYDTDSVIFVSNGGDEYMPPVGCYLGELTDELADYGIGSYCTHLIAAGVAVHERSSNYLHTVFNF